MKLKEKDHVVNYLVTQMSYCLLAKSPIKDALQQASTNHQNKLRAKLTKEEYEPILVMRDTVVGLAKMLANCESVEQLQRAHAYIEALNQGEVMVAIEDEATGEVVSYEKNR